MPATFPSHAAAVLPLKLWRPAWFDGVALVIGSAAPDLPYALGRSEGPPYTYGHTWWGVLASVPVTVAATRLVRRAAPEVAAHLPGLGPFAVGDYGTLGGVRHPWWVTAGSALVGAASHVAWDHVTHGSVCGTAVGIARLDREVLPGVPAWMPLHLASSAAGAAGWLALSARLGRRRRLVAWHGPAPAVRRRPAVFWGAAAAAATAGAAVAGLAPVRRARIVPFLPPLPRPSVLSGQLLGIAATALIAAAAAHRAVTGRGAGSVRRAGGGPRTRR
ncbi:DUF4184 family protein [Dactylosporangium aurantiacum]|uniref:DUF4184 family protein n=1 Tax=Dactylosporangium aurantiacum TaxID=35754 RepID=A0A9Q9MM32_9ACTN|nr:DUF4184 family protein [Dactylosporangium aurantiacum]MDG6103133.1 DUF4184 family protein [Dactylosporangium aurantiacum]UWZ57641.1 DUF4184 family protein [Dactylosporangium aurantiacum]